MKKIIDFFNVICIIAVFCLKVIYLELGIKACNNVALVLICIFIAIQMFLVKKHRIMLIVFVFSFMAELLNLIYDGKNDLTMLGYLGMHLTLLIYFLKYFKNQKLDLFYKFPLSIFVIFLVFSFGTWTQKGMGIYLVMVFYSALLCVNLALSYNVNRLIFTGMLMVFIVDTVVVWTLVPGDMIIHMEKDLTYGLTLVRGLLWLPFLMGVQSLREGALFEYAESSKVR